MKSIIDLCIACILQILNALKSRLLETITNIILFTVLLAHFNIKRRQKSDKKKSFKVCLLSYASYTHFGCEILKCTIFAHVPYLVRILWYRNSTEEKIATKNTAGKSRNCNDWLKKYKTSVYRKLRTKFNCHSIWNSFVWLQFDPSRDYNHIKNMITTNVATHTIIALATALFISILVFQRIT